MALRRPEARQLKGAARHRAGPERRHGIGGSRLLWVLLGLTGMTLAALATLVLLAPRLNAPDGPAGVIGTRAGMGGTAAAIPAGTPSTREAGARPDPDTPASATAAEAQQLAPPAPVAPAGSPTPRPRLAFEEAPGVLSVSLRTRRKDALKAYPTESLGAIALGLEDLRLAPSPKDGRLAVNLGELIRYEQKEHQVPKTARRLLDGIARLLVENPDTEVEILSHTDDEGEAGFNLRLSQRRADAIKGHLVERGVDQDRITARGRGEEVPLVDTGRRTPTRDERAKNRRTELVIVPFAPADEAGIDPAPATAPSAALGFEDGSPPPE